MAKPVTPYQAPKLEDGEVVIYPLRPFGKGYVLERSGSERLRREGAFLAFLAFLLFVPAPFSIFVLFGVYVWRVRHHAHRRVPAVPVRTWAKLQAEQTSRLVSGLVVVLCSVIVGVLGNVLGGLSTFTEAAPWLVLTLLVSLIGMYGMWMFRIRGRVRRGWW